MVNRKIFRQLVDDLTACEKNTSPSREGLSEDDVVDERLATVPLERARKISPRMGDEHNYDCTCFSSSQHDVFGLQRGWEGQILAGKGEDTDPPAGGEGSSV